MTVRADRNEIILIVYFVFLSNLVDRGDVVDMNEPSAHLSVFFLEIEPAYAATAPVVLDAHSSGNRTSFIFVNVDSFSYSLSCFCFGYRSIGKEVVKR